MISNQDADIIIAAMTTTTETQLTRAEFQRLSAIIRQHTEQVPVPIRLHCPQCHDLHIDEGDFATKSHHTHSCQSCGHTWRPAVVPTVGVRFLPGFKNDIDDGCWTGILPYALRARCATCGVSTDNPTAYHFAFQKGRWYCQEHNQL